MAVTSASAVINAISQIVASEQNKALRDLLKERLSDAEKAVAKLEQENEALKERLKDYESDIADSQVGDRCPKCREPRLFLESEGLDENMGVFGTYRQVMVCRGCGHKLERLRDH